MPKAGPNEAQLGLMGLVPLTEAFEASIDMGHPDDCTGGMFFSAAPWKSLGSLSPSLQVGMMPGAHAS